jgi:hypothetical protein
MSPVGDPLRLQLTHGLAAHEQREGVLKGLASQERRLALLGQVIESVRRIQYIEAMRNRPISERRLDPLDPLFDPLRAAVVHSRRLDLDEACWLVFLSVHFGRHLRKGWHSVAHLYAGEGTQRWTWQRVSRAPALFRTWLNTATSEWKRTGVKLPFGNHRKYQSLGAHNKNGTGHAIASYVEWVLPHGEHSGLFRKMGEQAPSPAALFDKLFHSMDVASFGRMARFDYLTMLGKLQLAPMTPGSPYLADATGPLRGARLLLANNVGARLSVAEMEPRLIVLGRDLGVGMQEIEDSICNWQKSPDAFKPFRG